MWLVFSWTRYSCGNTQNTQNWGQAFPVLSSTSSPSFSSSSSHCCFPAWFRPSLGPIGAAFLYCDPGEHMNSRNVSCVGLQLHVALIKMDLGRRGFWVMSEKCWGVLSFCLSFSVLFGLCAQQIFGSLLCCSLVFLSVSQKLPVWVHICLLLFIFLLIFLH